MPDAIYIGTLSMVLAILAESQQDLQLAAGRRRDRDPRLARRCRQRAHACAKLLEALSPSVESEPA
jgi:hypothetical protein